jgi:hypothetical protein
MKVQKKPIVIDGPTYPCSERAGLGWSRKRDSKSWGNKTFDVR